MSALKYLILIGFVNVALAEPSAVEVLQDMYRCLQGFSIGCAQEKAVAWISNVRDRRSIRITDDLVIVKNGNLEAQDRAFTKDNILDRFDNFLVGHNLIATVPSALKLDGPLTSLVPRSFLHPEPIQVPFAATGRSSKIVKKVIFPFLVGLKFNTAVLVPLALGLIALKTWKALTLGLISLVLSGAVALFSKFVKPPQYEVVHYPHVDTHHIDVITPQLVPQPIYGSPAPVYGAPAPVYGAPAPVYGAPIHRRRREALEIAYKAHL